MDVGFLHVVFSEAINIISQTSIFDQRYLEAHENAKNGGTRTVKVALFSLPRAEEIDIPASHTSQQAQLEMVSIIFGATELVPIRNP